MFSFQENNAMFSVTPVQNMFIEEILPRLTGDAVKVYLYGLKCCYYPPRNNSMEAFAQTLGMEQSEVLQCLSLLEKNGVIRKISEQPPKYVYFNQLYNAFTQSGTPEAALIRSNQAFINRVNALFEGRQILHETEYTFLYDWIDTLGFSQDAVLIFLQYQIKKSGPKKRLNFSRLDKEIVTWHEEGALTLQSAQSYARTLTERYRGAERVLQIFNIRRAPDYGEEVLYEKWEKLGFEANAIEYAAKRIDGASNPNLKYLDTILERYLENGITKLNDMRKADTKNEENRNLTREILRIFGSVNRVSDETVAQYQSWRTQGFTHAFLCQTARYILRKGQSTLQDLDHTLSVFQSIGVKDEESLAAFRADEGQVYAVLHAMGQDRKPTFTDIQFCRVMRDKGLTQDALIDLAARSRSAAVPMTYFMRLAREAVGETVPEMQTAAETSARPAPAKPAEGKRVSGQTFAMQRSYTDEEYESLIDDLSEWDALA